MTSSASRQGEAQHGARKAGWELERFKGCTATVLGTLGRELIELDAHLGDVVLAAVRELES